MRKIAIVLSVCAVAFTACSSKKKVLNSSELILVDSASESFEHSQTQMQTDYFDDYLQSSFALSEIDTTGRTIESKGLRLKVKRLVDKSGNVSLGFQAESKPVARTKLQYSQAKTETHAKSQAKDTRKTEVIEKSKWSGLLLWVILGALIAAFVIKRIDQKMS